MMKEDWTPIDFGQTEDTTKNIIKVIGVGGGGCNAVKKYVCRGYREREFRRLQYG